MFQDGLLEGKRILITGGGSGLGKLMGRRFVELGAEVIVCSRRLPLLQETVDEFTAIGGKARCYELDIRKPEMVEETVARIWNDGPPNVLINNAAANFISRSEDLSHRALDAILNPTLHGTLYMTLACGKRWLAEKSPGTVLSIVSTSFITGRGFTMPSAASKAGIVAMTRSLAVEWGPRGIRLNAIAPGAFPTEGAWSRLAPKPEMAQRMNEGNPLHRPGRPDELTNLAAYLVSDHSGYVHGEVVTIDGGGWLLESQRRDLLAYSDEDWRKLREK